MGEPLTQDLTHCKSSEVEVTACSPQVRKKLRLGELPGPTYVEGARVRTGIKIPGFYCGSVLSLHHTIEAEKH